jgi:hypothetical protein
MSLYGAFDKTKHLGELDDPLFSNEGVKSPSVRKAEVLTNLGLTATAAEINAAADTSGRIVAIPDDTTYTVLATDSGKTHILPDLTGDIVITLPAASAGLEYTFMYSGVTADAQDWQFDTTSDDNFYLGGFVQLLIGAGDTDDEVIRQVPNGTSNSIANVLTPDVGTEVKLFSDGTNWFLNGQVVSATADAVTWADQ